MLISITGNLGSGKSTVCDILKNQFDFEIYSTGTVQREYARKLGITTLELNKKMKENPELDKEIDSTVTRISMEKKDDNLIFDSRMAWHFAKHTFKVFLTVDPMEAAKRVFANQRGDEEKYDSVDDACEKLIERSHIERDRFIKIYGVDYYDFNNYNIIIDTTKRSAEEIVDIIIQNFKVYNSNNASFGTNNIV